MLIRTGCYFCEGPHNSEGCHHGAEFVAAPAENLLNVTGFVGSIGGDLCTGLFASVGTDQVRTANVATQRGGNQRQDKFCVDDSGATEYMTQDPAGLEDYVPPPARQRVEGAGGIFLPVVGYRCICLLVDQVAGNVMGPTRQLVLERVTHVPGRVTLSRRNG